MNENLDLTKILDGCPKGTKLYSTIYGEVSFEKNNISDEYPIELKVRNNYVNYLLSVSIAKDGRLSYSYEGECTLFPSKDQRDWSKFERFWDKLNVEKFDPKTLQPFDKVLVRDEPGDCWIADIFSHIDDSIGRVCCSCFRWKQCIPYNEETKHLIGTTDDCSEYYKWWEE